MQFFLQQCLIGITNGALVALPVSVDGGFWAWFNPGGGLTALTVTTSANASFRVYLFT